MKRTVWAVLAAVGLSGALALAATSPRFRDVPANHWAHAAITSAAAKGVMPPRQRDRFEPEQTVTRAELAVILVRMIDYLETKGPQKLSNSPAKPHVPRAQRQALAKFPRTHRAYPALKRLVEGGYVVPNIHGEVFLPTRETIDRPVTPQEVSLAMAGVAIRVLEKRVGVEHPESLQEGYRLGPDDVRPTVPRGEAHPHEHAAPRR